MKRKIRMGIDVGGTHTKAVAIDNDTHEIIGKSTVKTTHDDKQGVAVGVVKSFINCLKENDIDAKEVIFVAHSTTQATNALLEGDVANVGVVAIGKGFLESFLTKRQANIDNIDLGNGKKIVVQNRFMRQKDLTDQNIRTILEELLKDKVDVIVASMAFGVDDSSEEYRIKKIAESMGLATTAASDITKLYGLTRRTRTAAINASILPTMLETADQTATSVKKAGVEVPLMIMRGDGGVMSIDEMKNRPVLTMLSGPAASVMGALMYLRVSNGIFVEVGGTSTDISVIKNGRPAVDYSIIGGHKTYVNSLDVRVSGIAGGSMVRTDDKNIVAVGPRSAHIAHLEYCAFTDDKLFEGATVKKIRPTPSDPDDYAVIQLASGQNLAITPTCAANALGILQEEDFSNGNISSCKKAMELLGEYLGKSPKQVALDILDKATDIVIPVIEDLIEKYRLEREQVVIVGAGGGAGPLVRHGAKRLGMKFEIPENAEVISSIGVALAMVREMVERIVPNPTPKDLQQIKQEAINVAIESGATEESIEVHLEIDTNTSKVTAIALGSTEVRSTDLLAECTEEDALQIARENLGKGVKNTKLMTQTPYFYVYNGEKGEQTPVRILDVKGFVRVQRNDGKAMKVKVKDYKMMVEKLSQDFSIFMTDSVLRPDFYVCSGPRLMDYDGSVDMDQLYMLMDVEMSLLDPEDEIILIATKNELR